MLCHRTTTNLGHYLFLEARSFPWASLSENCLLLDKDNAREQISEHNFSPNSAYCLYIFMPNGGFCSFNRCRRYDYIVSRFFWDESKANKHLISNHKVLNFHLERGGFLHQKIKAGKITRRRTKSRNLWSVLCNKLEFSFPPLRLTIHNSTMCQESACYTAVLKKSFIFSASVYLLTSQLAYALKNAAEPLQADISILWIVHIIPTSP